MNSISHRAWPNAVAREGPGTKVPWVMERCAAHIEQYGLQVGSAPDHPCRLGTLAGPSVPAGDSNQQPPDDDVEICTHREPMR